MTPQEKARQLRPLIVKASASLDDSDALDALELYDKWEVSIECIRGIRYRYNDSLYRCEQTHIAQADRTPDIIPALFTKVAKPGEIPVWTQPTGAQDAYQTGDKVHYPTAEDEICISTVNDNVWQPGVYGWEIYKEN